MKVLIILILSTIFYSKTVEKVNKKTDLNKEKSQINATKTTNSTKKSSRSLEAAMNDNDPNKLPGNRPPFTFQPATVVGDVKKDDEEAPAAKGDDVDAISTASSSPMAGPGLLKQQKWGLTTLDSAFCESKCKPETFNDLKGEPLVTCIPTNGGEEKHMPHSSDPCFMCTDAGGVCALAKSQESFVKTQAPALEKYKPKDNERRQ